MEMKASSFKLQWSFLLQAPPLQKWSLQTPKMSSFSIKFEFRAFMAQFSHFRWGPRVKIGQNERFLHISAKYRDVSRVIWRYIAVTRDVSRPERRYIAIARDVSRFAWRYIATCCVQLLQMCSLCPEFSRFAL